MGDWSEYFEDFPEENPANWVGGRFDPAGAAAARARASKVSQETVDLHAEIKRIIQKHSQPPASGDSSKKP